MCIPSLSLYSTYTYICKWELHIIVFSISITCKMLQIAIKMIPILLQKVVYMHSVFCSVQVCVLPACIQCSAFAFFGGGGEVEEADLVVGFLGLNHFLRVFCLLFTSNLQQHRHTHTHTTHTHTPHTHHKHTTHTHTTHTHTHTTHQSNRVSL